MPGVGDTVWRVGLARALVPARVLSVSNISVPLLPPPDGEKFAGGYQIQVEQYAILRLRS